jgi:hypothetical protein
MALGLTLGIFGMVSGGGLRRQAGALECWRQLNRLGAEGFL